MLTFIIVLGVIGLAVPTVWGIKETWNTPGIVDRLKEKDTPSLAENMIDQIADSCQKKIQGL